MNASVKRMKRATALTDEVVSPTVSTTESSSQKNTCSSNLLSDISSSSRASQLPSDHGDHRPSQPYVADPPMTLIGKKSFSFQNKWYSDWSWLEYSLERDSCFCFPCLKFLATKDQDTVFTQVGFKHWKTATVTGKGFSKHGASEAHMDAMAAWVDHKKSEKKGESLCDMQVENNRYYLSRVFEIIKFITTNELPFRGSLEEVGGLHSELFLKMVEFTMNIDEKFADISRTVPEHTKYSSPVFQNNIIGFMADLVREKSVHQIKTTDTGLFTIKCDGTRDSAGIELLSVVIRFVKENGPPTEALLGLYELERFDADDITEHILQALKDLDLRLLLAQCYDGASVMSGKHSGVQHEMNDVVERSVPYIHCFNQKLHLVVVHVCQKVKMVREFFDMCEQLSEFLAKPKVRAVCKNSGGPILALLMKHRWSGHFNTTNTIMESYKTIISALDYFAGHGPTDVSLTAVGLKRFISQEKFVLAGLLMHKILGLFKPADKMLQSRESSAVDSYRVVKETVQTLHNMRTKTKFAELFEACQNKCRLHDEGALQPAKEQPLISVYFKILDTLIEELERRFSESNSELVASICALLPCSEKFLDLDELQPLIDLVSNTKTTFDSSLLQNEVETVRNIVQKELPRSYKECRTTIDKFLEWFYKSELQAYCPNLHTLLCAALTIGASSATRETTSLPVTRLLTLYKRSMTHQRKCQLTLLGLEKEKTAALSVTQMIKTFHQNYPRMSM